MMPDRHQLGRGRPRAPEIKDPIMSCDDRIELRLPAAEKRALVQYARSEGVPVSLLLRRAIRVAMKRHQALTDEQSREIVAMRRHINQLGAQISLANSGSISQSLTPELQQLRADARNLLGRGR